MILNYLQIIEILPIIKLKLMANQNQYYVEGKEAYSAGLKNSDNPYTPGTIQYMNWSKGWDDTDDEPDDYSWPDFIDN